MIAPIAEAYTSAGHPATRHSLGRLPLTKELGRQFGIKGLCCQKFWATEAACHLAITAYNLCVLLQRRLGQLGKCELVTLRWRLFIRAAVFSRAQGKATLKLAVEGRAARDLWLRLLEKLTALPNCHAIESLQA